MHAFDEAVGGEEGEGRGLEDGGVVPDPHHDAGTVRDPGAEVVEQRALSHVGDGAVGRKRPAGAIQKPPAMPCGR